MSQGEEALSQFGHEFLTAIHNAALQCAKERDELSQEIKEVKEMQEQHAKEELAIFKPPSKEKEPSISSPPTEEVPPTNNPPIEDRSSHGKEIRKSNSAQSDDGADNKNEINNTDSTPTTGIQNGVQKKPVIQKKKRTLSLKNPTSLRQPMKSKRDVEKGKPPTPTGSSARGGISTPPTPTSRGIPSPTTPTSRGIPSPTLTTKSRGPSRNIPSPAVNRSLSSMGSKGRSASSRSVSQSGSGIPKISPRSGIPRALSTPSRLSQGGDSVTKKTDDQ